MGPFDDVPKTKPILAGEVTRNVAMFAWETGADIVRANDRMADIFGLPRGQARRGLPSKAYSELMHPADRERIARTVRTQSEGIFRLQYTILREDGASVPVFVSGYCFCDDEGHPIQHIGMLHLGVVQADPVVKMIDLCLEAYELADRSGQRMVQYLLGLALMELGFDLADAMRA